MYLYIYVCVCVCILGPINQNQLHRLTARGMNVNPSEISYKESKMKKKNELCIIALKRIICPPIFSPNAKKEVVSVTQMHTCINYSCWTA